VTNHTLLRLRQLQRSRFRGLIENMASDFEEWGLSTRTSSNVPSNPKFKLAARQVNSNMEKVRKRKLFEVP